MVAVGVPFLRLRSFGVFLIFTTLSFIGFMRAIKNTKVPMMLNLIGIGTFVFFDYALILGKFGFPKLNLNGSAWAVILQYAVMNVCAIGYILFNTGYKKYFSKAFYSVFNIRRTLRILRLSLPVMIDKGSYALSYVWLAKMLAPMGTYAIATFEVIKNLERFAFLPATALAQVITFLVSNRLGAKDYDGAVASIKKVLILAAISVSIGLLFLSFNARYFVGLFDPTNSFTDFGAKVFPLISIFVIFDYLQVILAGSLRGAGDVKSVMLGRALPCFLFFIPFSYFLNQLPVTSMAVKFAFIYIAHYLNNGLMAFLFLRRIKSHRWQKKEL